MFYKINSKHFIKIKCFFFNCVTLYTNAVCNILAFYRTAIWDLRPCRTLADPSTDCRRWGWTVRACRSGGRWCWISTCSTYTHPCWCWYGARGAITSLWVSWGGGEKEGGGGGLPTNIHSPMLMLIRSAWSNYLIVSIVGGGGEGKNIHSPLLMLMRNAWSNYLIVSILGLGGEGRGRMKRGSPTDIHSPTVMLIRSVWSNYLIVSIVGWGGGVYNEPTNQHSPMMMLIRSAWNNYLVVSIMGWGGGAGVSLEVINIHSYSPCIIRLFNDETTFKI